jgi:hypothetical protein
MDTGKLESLISTAALFFCRLHRLRDPYEGLPNSGSGAVQYFFKIVIPKRGSIADKPGSE